MIFGAEISMNDSQGLTIGILLVVNVIQGFSQLNAQTKHQIQRQTGARTLSPATQAPQGHASHIFINQHRLAVVLKAIQQTDDGRMAQLTGDAPFVCETGSVSGRRAVALEAGASRPLPRRWDPGRAKPLPCRPDPPNSATHNHRSGPGIARLSLGSLLLDVRPPKGPPC